MSFACCATLDIDAVVIASCYHEQMTETLIAAGYPADRIEIFLPLRLVTADQNCDDDTAVETPQLVHLR